MFSMLESQSWKKQNSKPKCEGSKDGSICQNLWLLPSQV